MARVDAALGQSSLAETRAKARAIEMEELRQVQQQLEQARLEPSEVWAVCCGRVETGGEGARGG